MIFCARRELQARLKIEQLSCSARNSEIHSRKRAWSLFDIKNIFDISLLFIEVLLCQIGLLWWGFSRKKSSGAINIYIWSIRRSKCEHQSLLSDFTFWAFLIWKPLGFIPVWGLVHWVCSDGSTTAPVIRARAAAKTQKPTNQLFSSYGRVFQKDASWEVNHCEVMKLGCRAEER